MKTKIVLIVDGGVIQEVFATPDARPEIVVVDHDELRERGLNSQQREDIGLRETADLVTVTIGLPSVPSSTNA